MAINKILKRSLAALAVAGFMGLTTVRAQEASTSASTQQSIMDAMSLELGVDWYSEYVWRGMLLTNDPVLQPSVTLGLGGFSLNVWGSFDVTDVNENDNTEYALQELDFTLGYETTFNDMVTVGVGFIEYTFPGNGDGSNNAERTSEVYASAGLDIVLQPTLTVYWDFDEVDGFYATLGVGHTFELTEALGLSLGGTLGWGDRNYHEYHVGNDTNGLSDYNVKASLDYAVTENLSVSVVAVYSNFVDTQIADAAERAYDHNENIYGGVLLGLTF